eukprot:925736-Rhodomonas_salina.1
MCTAVLRRVCTHRNPNTTRTMFPCDLPITQEQPSLYCVTGYMYCHSASTATTSRASSTTGGLMFSNWRASFKDLTADSAVGEFAEQLAVQASPGIAVAAVSDQRDFEARSRAGN